MASLAERIHEPVPDEKRESGSPITLVDAPERPWEVESAWPTLIESLGALFGRHRTLDDD